MKRSISLMLGCLLLALGMPAFTQAPAAVNGQYNLADFGPVKTAAEAQATLLKAIEQLIAGGGGVLVVAPGVAPEWKIDVVPPSTTKANSPGVTIIDRRNGYETVWTPASGKQQSLTWTGNRVMRNIRGPLDRAMAVTYTQGIDTFIAGQSSSYDQYSLAAVKAGPDQRIYVPTIRGIAVGMQMVITSAVRNYVPPYDYATVKTLGWDPEQRKFYFTADLKYDHPEGALVYDKHVIGSLSVIDHSHSDNQSMAIYARRDNYAQGDSFTFASGVRSMSNLMSGAGDEGALAYAADIYNDLQPFHSTVESVNWAKQELVYAPGFTRNFTLGTSRPIINMNPQKWLTGGVVYIVPAGMPDPWGIANGVFPGGAIIGVKECGWTQEVVGRFFAIDEPSEYLDPKNDPGAGYTNAPEQRVYRWYLIAKFEERADGSMRIYVERTKWWSRIDMAPTLYASENLTVKNRLRPLHYIIAPGAYVADVGQAWTDSEVQGGCVYAYSPRTLKLAPNGDIGTKYDFAKGDPIVQAIGQDPWNPSGVRVRHHNYLPSVIEDASFAAYNVGRVSVNAGLLLTGGGGGDITEMEKQKDKAPMFMYGMNLAATSNVGINFGGDVRQAAILFQQPHGRAQPILWSANGLPAVSLVIDPKTTEIAFRGRTLHVDGLLLTGNTGISAGAAPAKNLRGINANAPAGALEVTVRFARTEADAAYAVSITPSWLTALAVHAKTAEGFTIQFEKPAPVGATFDWVIIR